VFICGLILMSTEFKSDTLSDQVTTSTSNIVQVIYFGRAGFLQVDCQGTVLEAKLAITALLQFVFTFRKHAARKIQPVSSR